MFENTQTHHQADALGWPAHAGIQRSKFALEKIPGNLFGQL
jgi:hypothetical protein